MANMINMFVRTDMICITPARSHDQQNLMSRIFCMICVVDMIFRIGVNLMIATFNVMTANSSSKFTIRANSSAMAGRTAMTANSSPIAAINSATIADSGPETANIARCYKYQHHDCK